MTVDETHRRSASAVPDRPSHDIAASVGAGLDHVTLTVADLAAATAFYDAVLAPLGLSRLVDYEDPEDEDEAGIEAVGYGVDAVELWLVVGAQVTTGLHLAFSAANRAAVEAAHADAVVAGAVSEHAPRGWQIYRPGRYAAMLRDPAGNIVEAFTEM